MSDFDEAFEEVIGLEGGYVNDPDDPGGETKFGISKRAYPKLNIAAISLEDAKQIYWNDYWNPLLLAQLNEWPEAQQEIFEQAVNFGKARAVSHVQRSLNFLNRPVADDGVMGPVTMRALLLLPSRDRSVFVKVMNGLQFIHYAAIVNNNPSQKKFFVGWLRRVSFA